MSKRGENIHHRKDGRWEGRIKIGTYSDGRPKYKSLYGKTYKEIKSKMQTVSWDSFQVPLKNKTSFEFVLLQWLENSSMNRKKATQYKYKYIIEKHIVPELGHMNVAEINSSVINAFLNKKIERGCLNKNCGLSESYVRTMSIIIQSTISFAFNEKIIHENNVLINKPTIKKKDIPIFSKSDQALLENFIRIDTDSVKLGIMISLCTGLRIGEVCALAWNDIDLNNDLIHVRHTISRVEDTENVDRSTKLIIDTPKTESSIRDIPISSGLKKYILKQKEMSSSPFVISDKDSYVSPRTYEYRYHKVLKECGINNINYHALRHTFATRCIEAGIDVKTVSEILGHSNVSITLNTYVHPSMDTKRAQLEKLMSYSF